jgi:PTS system N-acetylglucosamine-specific IIC component
MIIPLGLAAFVVFYLVFRVMITALDLKTPGREESSGADEEKSAKAATAAAAAAAEVAKSDKIENAQENSREDTIVEGFNLNAILDGLGGKENIQTLDNCVTRLRVEVKDSDAVNEGMLKAAGAKAVVRPGAGSVQVVIGLKVQKVADELRKMI